MRQHDICTCVSTVSVVSVSRLSCQLSKFSARTTKRVRSNVVKDHFYWSFGLVHGGEKCVHRRPSWELAPYDCGSQNTVMRILPRGVNLCRRNAASMIALESAEWFDLHHNFFFLLFWTRPKHFLLESEQGVKQRDLHDNRRTTIKGGRRENGVREAGDCDPPVPPHTLKGKTVALIMIRFLSQNHIVQRNLKERYFNPRNKRFPPRLSRKLERERKLEPRGGQKRKRFLKKSHGDVCCVANRYPEGPSRSVAPNFLLSPDPFFLSNTPANISAQTILGNNITGRRGVICGLDFSLNFTVDSTNRLCSLSTDRSNRAIVLQCSG